MPQDDYAFRFVEFKPTRAFRGAEAARVEITINGEAESLWMSVEDLQNNIREFGAHPELLRALAAYGIELAPTAVRPIIDCPALHTRGKGYPFGDRVPRRIRMRKTVAGDPMPILGFALANGRAPQVAVNGMELDAWTNSWGAVCAVFPDGEKLGVKPDEFEVIEWHVEQGESCNAPLCSDHRTGASSESGQVG